jgi:hypothetical protein
MRLRIADCELRIERPSSSGSGGNPKSQFAIRNSQCGRWRLAASLGAALWCLGGMTPAHGSGEPDAFALPGIGARPMGMGGAFIGLSDDVEAVYYNPAGLGNLIQSGVTAMYQDRKSVV